MSRIIICDRCQSQIPADGKIGYLVFTWHTPGGGLTQENELAGTDYCEKCMAEIRACIDKKPEEDTPRKRVIDKGKIMALHKAGWINDEIAKDVGCSAAYVGQIIKAANTGGTEA